MKRRANFDRLARHCVLAGIAAAATACNSQTSVPQQAPPASAPAPAPAPQPRSYSLTIYGYNYTDTGIGSFEVNGQGGGNLMVSGPTSGGGSSVCCVSLHTPLPPDHKVKIKWTRDGDIWCEQEVMVRPPVPPHPKYFEVHFYRDGHVEVAITEVDSDPRLKLDRASSGSRHQDRKININNDGKFGSCKRGY